MMATTTAWTNRYTDVLRDRLGLEVSCHPDHLRVVDGFGWIYHVSSHPDTAPGYVQVAFAVNYTDYHDLLATHPGILGDLVGQQNAVSPVKVIATGLTGCIYLIHAHLTGPGALPNAHQLTAVIPTWLNLLTATHEGLLTELDAATLYHA